MKHPLRFPARSSILATLALCASLGLLFVAQKTIAGPAATTINVTSTNGGTGGPECRLRDAISAANASGVVGGCDGSGGAPFIIELQTLKSYQLSVVDNNENGLPIVASEITINGNRSTIARSTDAATPNFRLFEVAAGGKLSLNDLTVRDGGTVHDGGGLYNSGRLTLQNCLIMFNYASVGAGIANQATGILEIEQSRLVYNYGGCGGALINNGVITLTASTVMANSGYE